MMKRKTPLSLSFGILCALLIFAGCAQPDAAPEAANGAQADPAHVLIVGGGSSHDFDRWFNEATVATLESAGVRASYTDVPEQVLPALAEADILYLTNNQPLPDSALRAAIFNVAESGKGLMIGHAGAWYNWADWPEYNKTLVGGGTRSHRHYGEFTVTVVDTTHPVMEGVPSTFTLADELYRFEQDPEGTPIKVLATAEEVETGEVYPIVWEVLYPGGRIVVNTLGHDEAAHTHPAYQRILQNSVRWVSGQSL